MSFNTVSTSPEFSEPVEKILSKAQQNVIDRVVLILESDPELNKRVSAQFEKNFLDVVSDEGKFNALLEKIGATEMVKLWEIEVRFQKGKISNEVAIAESSEIIERYTNIKLTALRANIAPTQQVV